MSLRTLLSILLVFILTACLSSVVMAADLDLEKDLLHSLAGTKTIILKLEQGQAAQTDLDQLQVLVEDITATHLLLEERFRQREERARSLGRKATNRHAEMREAYLDALEEYLELMGDLLAAKGDVNPRVLERIKELIDQISPKKRRPILGSLPYLNLNYAAHEPLLEPVITPAYQGGDMAISPDDTTDTPEAPLSEEIAARAESLDWNPVLIYEWVKNNIETEWYWGCMKGAEETLRQKSGNDCDQAALLVALLRASGFPARYVQGVIEFFPDIEIAKHLTGIADERELAAFFQKAGIPSKPIIAGGGIANFQIAHIWVEAYIPYANYRGAVIDEYGKTWLALDTSIKAAGYTYSEPEPMPDEVSLAEVRQGYLGDVHDVTPLEYLRAQIEAALPVGMVYEGLLATRELITEEMQILPASLQFQEVAVTGEYSQIPEDLMHRVKFQATGPNKTELFTVTVESFYLSNKSVALIYEPETVEDQEIINSWGGLDNTPSYLIHLRPVLTVDGERVGVGQDGLSVGMEYDLTMELISPNDETEVITNTHIIGNLAVMGIVAQGAIIPEEIPFEEKDAQRLLFEEAISYIDSWNQAEAELASLMGLALVRPIPTVVTLGGVVEVTYLLDTPHGFEWRGVYVDADLRAVETAVGYGQEVSSEDKVIFMQLSSLQGSVLEHQVLQEGFQVESISTAKLFELANTNGVHIITIDAANIESILQTLPFAENIKEDITDAVNQGFIVRIPETEIIYEDWTGIGYIKEDPDTGEAGWMLSGMIAGSMTAQNISDWLEELIYTFLYPSTESPNEDPESAYFIYKIPKTDRQEGTVGKSLADKLQVIVFDQNGKPVRGTEVTFTIKAGGGTIKGGGEESETNLTVQTNYTGIAEVQLILGEETSDNPTMWWEEGYTYSQQVGENLIDAVLVAGTGAALTRPFIAYGFPDDATAKLRMLHGDGTTTTILSFAGFISVVVEDQYSNPIANKTLEFVATDASSDCVSADEDRLSALLVPVGDPCMQGIPSYGTCSGSSGAGKELEVVTSHLDAAVQIFTGAAPNASYPIQATCDEAPVNKTVTFHLHTYTFGNCSGDLPPDADLRIVSVHLADQYGRNINAGAVGSILELQARMYFLREGETTKTDSITCDGNPADCTKIVGSKEYFEDTEFETASVTFTNTKTGESIEDVTPDADGIFSENLTVAAGVNTIDITGEATATAKRKWTQTGCDGATMICKPMESDLTDEKTVQMWVYGVAITTDPKLLFPIDENGFTVVDVPITYTIAPSEYQAATAYLAILRDKEPFAYIPGHTKGQGTITLSRGFWFYPESDYEAYVVLNAGSGVEIRSEMIQLDLAQIYLEKQDPDVKLRWNDYYPPLGDKSLVIRAKDGKGNDITSDKIKVKAEVVYPTEGPWAEQVEILVDDDPADEAVQFENGKIEFNLSAPQVVPPQEGVPDSGLDRVEIKFTILFDDDKEVGELSGSWNIKNNSNTTLGEVLEGEAVFVYDESGEANHVGQTGVNVTDDKDKKVDFVQKLLNQVIPRKRSVGNNNYALMDEKNGIFDDVVRNAISLFKQSQHFNVNNETINNGKNSFNKIKKDYGLTDSNRIIDKETLVGIFQRDTDVMINGTAGSLDDTGLYELHKNVVEKFVKEMIKEAERYAGNAPTDNWVARTGEGPAGSTNPHGFGMSYGFGCKNTIIEFNHSINGVANCQAEGTDTIKNRETDNNNVDDGNEYRGNIGNNCIVGDGNRRWAGLYSEIEENGVNKEEYNLYFRCVIDNPSSCNPTEIREARAFNPSYWAGIDCSGLVYRTMACSTSALNVSNEIVTMSDVHTYDFFDNQAVYYFNVGRAFENDRVFNFPATMFDKIQKGDCVRYGNTHVSIIYSEKWGESNKGTDYDIIHAYGSRSYFDKILNQNVFSRKVTVTGNDLPAQSGGILQPSGFGRIKLWD